MTTILITRPVDQTEPLQSLLESLGATVLSQPTIRILPIEDKTHLDSVFAGLESFDWIVFSSVNGVRFFFDLFKKTFSGRNTLLSSIRFAAVGPGTDEALLEYSGRRADLVPDSFTAEGLAEKLYPEAEAGKRFLLPRGNRGRDVLKKSLTEFGGTVLEITVYQSIDVELADPEILRQMQDGTIDFVTATSSSIARSLVRLFGNSLRRTKIISISPITSQTLRRLGFPPDFEAQTASLQGIVEIYRNMQKR